MENEDELLKLRLKIEEQNDSIFMYRIVLIVLLLIIIVQAYGIYKLGGV